MDKGKEASCPLTAKSLIPRALQPRSLKDPQEPLRTSRLIFIPFSLKLVKNLKYIPTVSKDTNPDPIPGRVSTETEQGLCGAKMALVT